MCDRSKAEILARSLCIEIWWWNIDDATNNEYKNVQEFAEANWEKFIPTANTILTTLEAHKE